MLTHRSCDLLLFSSLSLHLSFFNYCCKMPNNSDSSAVERHGSFELYVCTHYKYLLVTIAFFFFFFSVLCTYIFFILFEFYGCDDCKAAKNKETTKQRVASKAKTRCALHYMNNLFTFSSGYLERRNLVSQVIGSDVESLGILFRFILCYYSFAQTQTQKT